MRGGRLFSAGKPRRVILACCLLCLPPVLVPAPLAAQSGGARGGGVMGGSAGAAEAAVFYERGRNYMALEEWYEAAEALLECIRLNSAHAEGNAALAECYYELAEFDEALVWVRKARGLARSNMATANLEAFILIALGRLDEAAAAIAAILEKEPYNREALFAAGELDVARGRSADALLRYREASRRYPDDRRLLISLALVSGSLGDTNAALSFIDRALAQHPDDYRVFYYAAYVNAQGARLPQAIQYAEQALYHKPDYGPARSLLASLRYRNGEYEEAERLAGQSITANREDMGAWYLKGLSLIRLNRNAEAITVLTNALAASGGSVNGGSASGDDEFIRALLEETLTAITGLEDPRRARWASWHFDRAREFRSRNGIDQAIFEYRRGLRLNPYARDRREYAELLRLRGYPARYLEELRFLQDQGIADRSLNDAVESYNALLWGALFRQWQVNPVEITGRHWKIAVFSLTGQSSFYHVDAGAVAASGVRDLLLHDRNIAPANLEIRQPSFSRAFRTAREAGADYFALVSVVENERDISLKAELFVGRTGAPAGAFHAFRTGQDRLSGAAQGITGQLAAALPFRGKLLTRRQAQALIDKGRADGVKNGDVYDVVKKGRPQIANEGIGLVYAADDLTGKITIENADEEVAAGSLEKNGFFDRIEAGDEIILQAEKDGKSPIENAANPELRSLLRTLR